MNVLYTASEATRDWPRLALEVVFHPALPGWILVLFLGASTTATKVAVGPAAGVLVLLSLEYFKDCRTLRSDFTTLFNHL